MQWLKLVIRACMEWLESGLDRICGPTLNPLTQLGALGWFQFWLIAFSGIYLFIFFDTGVTQAYSSIESISSDQWWAGGILRSVHRYASDGLVVVAFLHMLREFAMDRMRGRRWFAWVTGLALIGFIYVCGITGYWMVWDQLAQYVALSTSRWLDALPIFAAPLSRNFLSNAELSGRFFTLMVYLHIAAPLLMLLFMWVHIQRYNYALVNPALKLMIGTGAGFLLLSLLSPALSQAPANLDRIAATVDPDWFFLAFYPLMDRIGAVGLWWLVVAAFVLLAALPWLPRLREPPAAVVHLDHCNGCARCFDDCPFGAITMNSRSDGAAFSAEAVVDADLCVRCGICVGACPTATPFRRATALVPGIELPAFNLEVLRDQVEAVARTLTGESRILVFKCPHGAAVTPPAGASVGVIDVPCTGMVPPSFIDFVVGRRLADGAMLAGCREGDCYERLGVRWTEQRIAGERDPYLRDRVPRDRVAVSWAGPGQRADRVRALASFASALIRPRGAAQSGAPAPQRAASRQPLARPPRLVRYAVVGTLVSAAIGLLGFFSHAPAVRLRADTDAIVTLSFSHAGRSRQECRRLSAEEVAKLEPNMRRVGGDCPRGRWPVYMQLELDGRMVYAGTRQPAGLWKDGPSTLFARFLVPAGAQRARVALRESGRDRGFDASASAELDLKPGQNLVIEFKQPGGFTFK
jgi:ferredoxin/coenzyme F420-reducing hydrogenase delta subunit